VVVGEDEERIVQLINKGDKPMRLEDPIGDSEGGVFAVVLTETEIPAARDITVRVRFAPSDDRDFTTVYTFVNDSENMSTYVLNIVGRGIRPDPCQGVSCNNPPPPACLGTQTSRIYDPAGDCDEGECSYALVTETCAFGCNASTGLCNGDPCTGMACNTPPSACYQALGMCDDGACIYTPSNSALCNDNNPCTVSDSCHEGTCRGTPKSCSAPPASICLTESTRRVWSTQGTCDAAGTCQYTHTDQTCSFGCNGDNGQCNGDPCAGISCNAPPAPAACYQALGTCSNGGCTYQYNNTASCNDGNNCTTNDSCISGACYGTAVSCTTPPANTCVDANVLRVYSGVGSCNSGNGQCQYSSSTTNCAYGCLNGACKNEPTYGQDTISVKLVFQRSTDSFFTNDMRDIDLQYVNPVGAVCDYDHVTPTWGNYGTAQWSATPVAYNNETIVHSAPLGPTADGNYRILGKVYSLCSEMPIICVDGICICTDWDHTPTTVEIRVNNLLKMTCTYTFLDNTSEGFQIEYATINRTNGFYGNPVPSGASGVTCVPGPN
jgi:hypothetical protein